MRHWIKTCESKHDCGLERIPDTMPTMLLNVDPCQGNRIKLVRVKPETPKTRYIALSYCWGPVTQKTTCLEANLSTLSSDGIGTEALDPTIQDAIVVARELGFSYLWVDALCMIQDNKAFMDEELGRMAEIYRYATFTIAASRAANVQDGFLTKRYAAGASTPNQVFQCQVDKFTFGASSAHPTLAQRGELGDPRRYKLTLGLYLRVIRGDYRVMLEYHVRTYPVVGSCAEVARARPREPLPLELSIPSFRTTLDKKISQAE
jgi:hypothetical protein